MYKMREMSIGYSVNDHWHKPWSELQTKQRQYVDAMNQQWERNLMM